MFLNLRSLIFKIDPETAHNLAIKSLKFNFINNVFDENKNDNMFATTLFGKKIENPIGIAAGFDNFLPNILISNELSFLILFLGI